MSDDNHSEAQLVKAWSKVSGPGTVLFGNAASPTSTVSFTTTGTYVLRLTVTEPGAASTNPLTNSDEVTLIVTNAPANQPPTLSVQNPKSVDSAVQGDDVHFKASASDPESGNISSGIVWTSSIDGRIGVGGDFIRNDLSVGVHTIIVSISDGQASVQKTLKLTITKPGSPPPPPPPPPGGNDTFKDDNGNIFEADIEWLAAAGITKGCNPPVNDMFCPNDYVTRGQMAAFLTRAFGYTDNGGGNLFVDDNNSVFEGDIDRLGTAGVTKGCNPPKNDKYCPNDFVTRGQMAAFLVRAFGYTDNGGGNLFVDDNNSVFEGDIDRLGTAGVTKGCNPPTNDRFCPNDYVTRGQMAAFLHRAFTG